MAYYGYKEVRDELDAMGWLDECADPVDKAKYGDELSLDYDGNIHAMAADAIRHYKQQRNRLKEALEIAVADAPRGYSEWIETARAALKETHDG